MLNTNALTYKKFQTSNNNIGNSVTTYDRTITSKSNNGDLYDIYENTHNGIHKMVILFPINISVKIIRLVLSKCIT